ncbi:Uncharacterized protein TCM_024472 [Theobroma cacao]|uniref:Reverse transcriptase zinc-binding domain-containing protein n=1 Tax=Theobroma cacao TaxID=3641 RepID=A0A061EVH5_THECC|nr:Uncharacterized protein TCM_024472 [Theobroma cacao]
MILSTNATNKELWKNVWAGLAPLKVEVFTWRVIRGRVPIKEELVKRNLLERDMALWPLCNKDIESVNHLFFTCPETWRSWSVWMAIWNVQGYMPNNATTFFMAWNYTYVEPSKKKIGLRGVLRDDAGVVKMTFSKLAGCGGANSTEILAINEAMISKPSEAPWRFWHIVSQIKSMSSKLLGWDIKHIPRSGNDMANSLAKDGVGR